MCESGVGGEEKGGEAREDGSGDLQSDQIVSQLVVGLT